MPHVERDGVKLYYESFGEGTPLVFLHPLSTNRYVWTNQIFAFARSHRVIVVDHRGHGLSDKPVSGYGIEQMAADLRAILDHAVVEKAVLVGNSAGAMVAVQSALDAPDRVIALLLVSCATHLAPGIPRQVFDAYESRFERAFDYMIRGATSAKTKKERPDVGAFLESVYRVRDNFSHATFLSCIRDPNGVFNWNVASRLAEIQKPTLVIAGQEDETMPREAIERLATGLGAELRVIPDVGHYYQLERPADFNEDLRVFLQGIGAG